MANVKLNKQQINDEDFNVIPDIPSMSDAGSESNVESAANTYVKNEVEDSGKKLFANKKANLALGIAGGVIAFLILATVIFINVPIK